MHKITPQQIIDHFNLLPHPEGGFYRESYRCVDTIALSSLPERYSKERSFATAIYYLLDKGACSRLHRLSSDEMWHFYLGDPLILFEIKSNGQLCEHILGQDILSNQHIQVTIPSGSWFGARLAPNSEFALVGCTMGPGFDFSELEFGNPQVLLQEYPQAKDWIKLLT